MMGKSKNECLLLYQDAHSCDLLRGESIKGLVQMYQRLKDWENAYVFSLYGLRYNQKNPYPHRILFLDKGIYDYEMLELHSLSCFYTNRIEEGSRCYWLMRFQLENLGNGYLSPDALQRVVSNEKYFPSAHALPQNQTVPQAAQRPKFPPHGGTKKKRKR